MNTKAKVLKPTVDYRSLRDDPQQLTTKVENELSTIIEKYDNRLNEQIVKVMRECSLFIHDDDTLKEG